MNYIPIIFLISAISIATIWDLKTRKIPNLLTYPMMLWGLIFNGISNGLIGLEFSAVGLIVGTCIFLIPYLHGGMGAGDAKLMGGIGAILGTTGVIVTAVISSLIGLIYAITLLVVHRDFGISFFKRYWITIKTYFFTRQWIPIPAGKEEEQPVLCYALPIALGTLCTVFLKVTESNLIQQVIGFQFRI